MNMDHYYFMRQAMEEAKAAKAEGEVPVGAVIVKEGAIIAKGHNRKETAQDPTAHAEILAITQAAAALGSWRLTDCVLYVNLEPCPMCAGAILQARLKTVVFGAWDLKWGGAGSCVDVLRHGLFNHEVTVIGGILERECAALLSAFFADRRK